MPVITINKLTLWIFLLLLVSIQVTGQTVISVDAGKSLNDVSKKPLGINVNYLEDDSYISPAPQVSTTEALGSMGIKFLRYPGGEKSDNYLWSTAPWTKASPQFARTGSCEWPSGDIRFAQAGYAAPKPSALDFDEFMIMCKTLNAEPLIVVAYDAIYKSIAQGCSGTIPTREQLIKTAEEWVRYANITKRFNIKYWMIGNESYNDSYNGKATPAQYRDDVMEFSRRMKAIDPSIKIIANGDGDAWWSTVLPQASSYIDFIGVSNYPVNNFKGGYEYYKNNTPDLVGIVDATVNAIKKYSPVSERNRIKVITTEFNAIDWAGGWANTNDLGHALVCFEAIGEHLKKPEVESILLWNTRWVNNTTNPSDLYDAISKEGKVEPNGMALSIWGNNLLDNMVYAESSASIRTFACFRSSTKELNVYIINKETTAQEISLQLNNYIPYAQEERWELSGAGPSDLSPAWTKTEQKVINGNSSLILQPVSITLLKLKPPGLTTSVQEPAPDKVLVSPNPAQDRIRIECQGMSGSVTVNVLTVSGQLVYSQKHEVTSGPIEVNTLLWSKGAYIITIDDTMQKLSQKVIVK